MFRDDQEENWNMEENLEAFAVTSKKGTAKFSQRSQIFASQVRNDSIVIAKISQCTWTPFRQFRSDYTVTAKILQYSHCENFALQSNSFWSVSQSLKAITKISQSLVTTKIAGNTHNGKKTKKIGGNIPWRLRNGNSRHKRTLKGLKCIYQGGGDRVHQNSNSFFFFFFFFFYVLFQTLFCIFFSYALV